MKKLTWLGLFLEATPILAFALLAMIHPIGDPQKSGHLFVRILDYQGTFWIRQALPVPPPPLLAGVCLLIPVWLRDRSHLAGGGLLAGGALLGLWTLIMIIPLLVHVN